MHTFVELLGRVPPPAWVLCGALVTALVAFVGVALTNRSNTARLQLQLAHEIKSQDRALRRDRCEELYVLVDRWSTLLVSDKLPYMKVMRGELTYNQALDMTIVAGDKENVPQVQRIRAIVEIYFPELVPDLSALFEARDSAAHIESTYRAQYKTGHVDGSTFLAPMGSALELIHDRAEKLQVRIAEAARAV